MHTRIPCRARRSASGTDAALVAAAIRLQAAERGRQARKRARKMAAEFLEPKPLVTKEDAAPADEARRWRRHLET